MSSLDAKTMDSAALAQWLDGEADSQARVAARYKAGSTFQQTYLGRAEVFCAAARALATRQEAEATEGEVEADIDRLRLAAFKTNSNEDKAAYYLAVSKWFQDRHYRRAALRKAEPAKPVAWQHRVRASGYPWGEWREGRANYTLLDYEERPLYATPQEPAPSGEGNGL